MLLNMCKSCQYCLETVYWHCCEERFCYDESIATCQVDESTLYSRRVGNNNMAASFDSVVTSQPNNNNNNNNNFLTQTAFIARGVNEMPLHADTLYQVFSKSLIFRDDHELKSKDSNESLDDVETKSEPDYSLEKPNRTKVYFEDEVNSPVTDFEIMFKDELMAGHDIFKIEEEGESDKRSLDTEDGLTMNVAVKKQDVIRASSITIKDETKMTTPSLVYKYDKTTALTLPSSLSLPRVESVKGILRQKGELTRSSSAKTLERVDSSSRLNKPMLNRVESLKNIDPNRINKVLSRVPHRSASFLNIPEHLMPEKPPLVKSKSSIGVASMCEENKLSTLPDTPIIKSSNLPRFFAESPTVSEYKCETSLQSIKQQTSKLIQENDFSMPRYYGTVAGSIEHLIPVHESKSMPDLRNPTSTGKVSKRLVKLRGRLKPLVIKKGTEEKL